MNPFSFPAASTFLHQTVFEGGGAGTQRAALGQFPDLVFALDCPALPACVTSPGAGHPGPRYPLGPWGWGGGTRRCGRPWGSGGRRSGATGLGGSRHGRDCRRAVHRGRLWAGEERSRRQLRGRPAGHEEAVANVQGLFSVCRQNLDHQRFLQGPGTHAVKPLVPLAPAAVVEHRTVEWDDRLRGRDHELAVQEVLAAGPPEGQVGGVSGLVFALVLTNLDVGGPGGDLHHVSVALTVWQEKQKRGQRSVNSRYRGSLSVCKDRQVQALFCVFFSPLTSSW